MDRAEGVSGPEALYFSTKKAAERRYKELLPIGCVSGPIEKVWMNKQNLGEMRREELADAARRGYTPRRWP